MQRSQDLGEALGLPQNPYRWRVALARLKLAQGDAHSALDLLEEAERRYVGDLSPNVRPIAALKTRLWIAQGRLAEARSWALALGLSAQDEPSYLREFEHLTLARILLAQYRVDQDETVFQELRGLLDRLLEAAETGGRAGSANEISVLQALAFEAHGQAEPARAALEHALVQAEPEGAVRLFVDEGPPMAALLRAAAQRWAAPPHSRGAHSRHSRQRLRRGENPGLHAAFQAAARLSCAARRARRVLPHAARVVAPARGRSVRSRCSRGWLPLGRVFPVANDPPLLPLVGCGPPMPRGVGCAAARAAFVWLLYKSRDRVRPRGACSAHAAPALVRDHFCIVQQPQHPPLPPSRGAQDTHSFDSSPRLLAAIF